MLKKKLEFIEKITARLLVFLIPTQLAFHFWPSFSFVFGIRVDYLSPAVYLTDILVFVLILLWYVNGRNSLSATLKKGKPLLTWLVLFAVINTFFSTSVFISFVKWLKILELVVIGLYFFERKSVVGKRSLTGTLFYSSLFFSAIGIAQFFLGRTTGLFYFLGERSFSIMTPGIALVQINGRDFLRAYSTFPHPNALAGFLGVVLLLIIGTDFLKSNKYIKYGVLLISLCMILTFSLTGMLGLVFSLFLYAFRKNEKIIVTSTKIFVCASVLLSLLMPMFSNNNFIKGMLSRNLAERVDLAYLSGRMISDNFLLGKGLNTFVVNIPEVNKGQMSVWLLQPVHNIYLLIFAETGIVGLLVFLWLIFYLIRRLINNGNAAYLIVFVFVLFTGTMDHYWITLQQNLLLLSFFLSFV